MRGCTSPAARLSVTELVTDPAAALEHSVRERPVHNGCASHPAPQSMYVPGLDGDIDEGEAPVETDSNGGEHRVARRMGGTAKLP